MLDHLKKFWASYGTVAAGAASFLNPSVQAWISGHPGKSVAVGVVWGIILHNMTAPKDAAKVS